MFGFWCLVRKSEKKKKKKNKRENIEALYERLKITFGKMLNNLFTFENIVGHTNAKCTLFSDFSKHFISLLTNA